jgi:hypothetical protein
LVSSNYPFGIFWLPLWHLLITPLVSSDYPFGIFWLPIWYLLINPLVSSDYPFGIFWLHLWYLLITPLVSSDYPFGIFWLPLWYLQTFLIPSLRQIGHDKWHFFFNVSTSDKLIVYLLSLTDNVLSLSTVLPVCY